MAIHGAATEAPMKGKTEMLRGGREILGRKKKQGRKERVPAGVTDGRARRSCGSRCCSSPAGTTGSIRLGSRRREARSGAPLPNQNEHGGRRALDRGGAVESEGWQVGRWVKALVGWIEKEEASACCGWARGGANEGAGWVRRGSRRIPRRKVSAAAAAGTNCLEVRVCPK